LVRLGRAYVVLPGGTGTLLELALVWERANKGMVRGPRPLVLLGEYWRPVADRVAPDGAGEGTLHMAPDVASVRQILRDHFGAGAFQA